MAPIHLEDQRPSYHLYAEICFIPNKKKLNKFSYQNKKEEIFSGFPKLLFIRLQAADSCEDKELIVEINGEGDETGKTDSCKEGGYLGN